MEWKAGEPALLQVEVTANSTGGLVQVKIGKEQFQVDESQLRKIKSGDKQP